MSSAHLVEYALTRRGSFRKLKPEARPLASPDDPSILVSGADCRMMAFESIQQASKLWIKGREFTVAKLLGPQYASEASKYDGGSLAIFRLAPQVRIWYYMGIQTSSTSIYLRTIIDSTLPLTAPLAR